MEVNLNRLTDFEGIARFVPMDLELSPLVDSPPVNLTIDTIEGILGESLGEYLKRSLPKLQANPQLLESIDLDEAVQRFQKIPFFINVEAVHFFFSQMNERNPFQWVRNLVITQEGLICLASDSKTQDCWPIMFVLSLHSESLSDPYEFTNWLFDNSWKRFEEYSDSSFQRGIMRNPLNWYIQKDLNRQPPMGVSMGMAWLRDFFGWLHHQPRGILSTNELQKECIKFFFRTYMAKKIELRKADERERDGCNLI